ncbi:hypothetical protein [Massilia sp. Mn16-1_5]|uniref:PDC sensor domain-containing protein n=1 Tax=Massilia sp. Mn16-1_5 TaxID=2079199 RepID=UPI00109E7D31|nr:hypothetical protein [Massilia sp. Mn16-1_5]
MAALLVASVLACTFAVWELWTSRRDRLESAAVATSNMARILALHAQTTFKAADLVLEDMVERAEREQLGASARDRLRDHLERVAGKARELHGLFVYDEHGEWVSTSLGRPVKANNSDREYFKYHPPRLLIRSLRTKPSA